MANETQYLIIHKTAAQGESPAKAVVPSKQALSDYLNATTNPKEIDRDYEIYKLIPIKSKFIPSRFEFSDDKLDDDDDY